MVNNQSHKYGANSTLYKVAMKGFPLFLRISSELLLFFLLLQNVYLQIRYIYLFPTLIPVLNPKSLVSCDKSHLSIKYNWSVARFIQNIFEGFLHGNTYVPYMPISSVARFDICCFPESCIFTLICTHEF